MLLALEQHHRRKPLTQRASLRAHGRRIAPTTATDRSARGNERPLAASVSPPPRLLFEFSIIHRVRGRG
ncbi:hypothetical protein MHYP_G00165040 [Metynnis hypsauchen]